MWGCGVPLVKHGRAVSDGSDEFWAVDESLSLSLHLAWRSGSPTEPRAIVNENER
jgi:hypothetical protein